MLRNVGLSIRTGYRYLPCLVIRFMFPANVNPAAGTIQWIWGCKLRFCPLAFRTIAVATAIVADAFLTATETNIYVSAQSRCATLLQGIEGTYHKTVGLALLNILLSKPIYDLGNFKLRTVHYF